MAQSWRPGSEVLSCQSSGVWGLVQRGMKGLVFMPSCWACISLCHNTEKLLEGGWHPLFNKAILALQMASTPPLPLAGPDTWKGLPYSLWGSRHEDLSPETSMPYAVHRRVLRSTFIIIHIFEMQLLK